MNPPLREVISVKPASGSSLNSRRSVAPVSLQVIMKPKLQAKTPPPPPIAAVKLRRARASRRHARMSNKTQQKVTRWSAVIGPRSRVRYQTKRRRWPRRSATESVGKLRKSPGSTRRVSETSYLLPVWVSAHPERRILPTRSRPGMRSTIPTLAVSWRQ
jgi:hypothetical protein